MGSLFERAVHARPDANPITEDDYHTEQQQYSRAIIIQSGVIHPSHRLPIRRASPAAASLISGS